MSRSSAKNEWGASSPTLAQMEEFFSQIKSGRITKSSFQAFLRGKGVARSIDEWLLYWEKMYKEEYGLKADFSELNIIVPDDPEFSWLFIGVQGLTMNLAYDVCRENFSCWRNSCYGNDFNKTVVENDRDPENGHYAAWFRYRQEADEELKNLSANTLKKRGILGCTLLERIVLEFAYYKETRDHLDIKNWTLCSGSRSSDGGVPSANWDGGRFEVDWDSPGSHGDGLRARAVVPCPPKAD